MNKFNLSQQARNHSTIISLKRKTGKLKSNMKFFIGYAAFLFISFQASLSAGNTYTQNIMDDMSIQLGSTENYDPEFVIDLRACMAKWGDDSLEIAVDAQWEGIVSYYQDPNSRDPWVNCIDHPNHERCRSSQYEEGQSEKAEVFGSGTIREMVIEEPCNYASNIAYYRGALRICEYDQWSGGESNIATRNALKRSFMALGSGSAFMHGSQTKLGRAFDVVPIAAIAYTSYESLITAIGGYENTFLRCLGKSHCATAEEVARRTAFLSLNHDVGKWEQELKNIKGSFPAKYDQTFAAIIVIAAYISFPDVIADLVLDNLRDAFDGSSFMTFLFDEFLPEVKPLIDEVYLGVLEFMEQSDLASRFIGSLGKLGYAFLFQEEFLDLDLTDKNLMRGTSSAFIVNGFADLMTGGDGFPFPDNFGLYPGSENCNPKSSHALWHQQSAEGLSDLNLMVDYIVSVIEKNKASQKDDGSLCAFDDTCKSGSCQWWVGKSFYACGDEPCWNDGDTCGIGSICNSCCNGHEWWWGKLVTACGEEPCWSEGTICGAGTSCHACCNGSRTPWYWFGAGTCK